MKVIENLVFKGGGVLGTAYVGVYQALQEVRLAGNHGDTVYGNVKRVAGTSAGSIFGALVALGLDAEKVSDIMNAMNFASFVDIGGNGGLCKGEAFLAWMKKTVRDNWPHSTVEDPTFAALHNLIAENSGNSKYKDLHVFARNVESGLLVEFSYQTTPDVPIAEAVRASMSIPFFFEPWQFPSERGLSGRYIDGGVAYNYPISDFDSGDNSQKTLGFFLMDMSYQKQGKLQTILHCLEHELQFSTRATLITESLFDLVIELTRKKQITLNMNEKDISEKLLSISPVLVGCLGIKEKAAKDQWERELRLILQLIATLELIYQDWVLLEKDQEALLKEIKALFELFGLEVEKAQKAISVLHSIMQYADILGATINPPSNMVFQRDAARTVVVNSLGYSFADFWIPECNKTRLVSSGYTCAKAYLDLIMYS